MDDSTITRRVIILISGCGQHEGQHHGMAHVEERLLPLLDSQTRLMLLPYDHNWRQLASKIRGIEEIADGPLIEVRIFGYSYGGGWGAMRLAKELEDIGISVSQMVLSDPVYRSDWNLLRWRSMMPPRMPTGRSRTRFGQLKRALRWLVWLAGKICPLLVPKIDMPWRIGKVTVFRQSVNLPMGHDLVPYSSATKVTYYEANVVHKAMDDLQVFHAECEKIALEEIY